MTDHLSHQNTGLKRDSITLDPSDKPTPKLPDSYVIHEPVQLSQRDVFATKLGHSNLRPQIDISDAEYKDEAWLEHVASILKKGTLAESDVITWSGYNSVSANKDSVKPPAEIGIYPVFPDKAASASSMKHAMELTMQSTEFLNPGQTSVLRADQPLYN